VETRVFKNDKNWDNEIPSAKYFSELFRVSQNQIIWGGNYFYKVDLTGIIIWNKGKRER
jgi:site-specific DNA-methyltransferase (adenine-specific)